MWLTLQGQGFYQEPRSGQALSVVPFLPSFLLLAFDFVLKLDRELLRIFSIFVISLPPPPPLTICSTQGRA